MSEFNDRFAVVTGASSGIGLKLTETLLGHGATVLAMARREGPPESVCTGWRATSPANGTWTPWLRVPRPSAPSITWYPTPASPSSPTAWTAWRSSSSGGSTAPGR